MSTLRKAFSEYWTRFIAAFHYTDPGPTRFWLITCAAAWGIWLLVVPGEISDVGAWVILATVGGEWVVGPASFTIAVLALIFDVMKSKRATVIADVLLTSWWLFIAITLISSRPESPSVSIYITLIGYGAWLIYRDADQI